MNIGRQRQTLNMLRVPLLCPQLAPSAALSTCLLPPSSAVLLASLPPSEFRISYTSRVSLAFSGQASFAFCQMSRGNSRKEERDGTGRASAAEGDCLRSVSPAPTPANGKALIATAAAASSRGKNCQESRVLHFFFRAVSETVRLLVNSPPLSLTNRK